jgi:hypothetical protein
MFIQRFVLERPLDSWMLGLQHTFYLVPIAVLPEEITYEVQKARLRSPN